MHLFRSLQASLHEGLPLTRPIPGIRHVSQLFLLVAHASNHHNVSRLSAHMQGLLVQCVRSHASPQLPRKSTMFFPMLVQPVYLDMIR
jgi:hypothetical protein